MRETEDSMCVGQAEVAESVATLPVDHLHMANYECGAQSAISPFSVFDGFPRKERKRRRVIGNHDNTLDGLVAKRAELDPATKRYQTEDEAIELPDDELELKRLETDPDVSTRMCSICGYQGKWVSEMVRHKRVHTSERPFKCRYCNRTSKWKADLIRHVAKTHGIRVVSKYSRSKAFDGQSETKCAKDENNNKESLFLSPKPFYKASSSGLSLPTTSAFYRCHSCQYENSSMESLTTHLAQTHNLTPFECRKCEAKFEDVAKVSNHFLEAGGECTAVSVKLNFEVVNEPSPALTVSTSVASPLSALYHSSTTIGTEPDSASTSGVSSCASSRTDDYADANAAAAAANQCGECAFRGDAADQLQRHRLGPEAARAASSFRCLFCNWQAKKRSALERHLLVHSARAEPCAERHFLAPLAGRAALPHAGGAMLPGLGAGPAQLLGVAQLLHNGGAHAPQLFAQPAAAPAAPLSALGLLSALCCQGGVGGAAPRHGRPQPAAPLLGSLPTSYGALKELPANPLMAFGLCSLIENISSQLPASTAGPATALTASSFDQLA